MKRELLLCLAMLLGSVAVQAQNDKAKTLQNQGKVTNCGTDPWQTLSADKFSRLVADSSVLIIDVRTPGEFREGHIPGARNLDVQNSGFDKAAGRLDRKKTLAVYCRSGVRSKAAAARLSQKGFRVVELEKGIGSWAGKQEK